MDLNDIRAKMIAAMKAGRIVEKEALRTAMGEITTIAARENRDATAEDVQSVVRKLVKSVKESLAVAPESHRAALEEELGVFQALLPQTLTVEQIVEALGPVAEVIQSAKSDGQATGMAMKHLKAAAAQVEGQNVAAAVAQLRRG